jgi:hypothetical protein
VKEKSDEEAKARQRKRIGGKVILKEPKSEFEIKLGCKSPLLQKIDGSLLKQNISFCNA